MSTPPDEFDDYDVEDVLSDSNARKRRKNSKVKGKRGELGLCKVFNKRFPTHTFSRTIGSGNRWSQVREVSKDFIGDIVCPADFRFVVECKIGYPEIDAYSAITGPVKQIDDFLKQAVEDANRADKRPMLCWKKDRLPWLVFLQDQQVSEATKFSLKYREWTAIRLSHLLEIFDDAFFFFSASG